MPYKNKETKKLYQQKYRKEHSNKFKNYQQKYYERNREGLIARSAKWQQENREKVKEGNKKRYVKNKNQYAGYSRQRSSGFTPERYASSLESQNNKCAICKCEFLRTPHADHDHRSGQQRGLLCTHCNSVIGFAKENIVVLEGAIEYLKIWNLLKR